MSYNGGFINIKCFTMAVIRRLVGVDGHVNSDMVTIFSIVVCLMLFSILSFIHTMRDTTTIRSTREFVQYKLYGQYASDYICVALHKMRLV